MEENNELMTIEETNELEEYEESSCSGLLNLAIGIGIGAVGTLLAKQGVSKFKSWRKSKTEEAQCDEEDVEVVEEEDVEVVEEDDKSKTK